MADVEVVRYWCTECQEHIKNSRVLFYAHGSVRPYHFHEVEVRIPGEQPRINQEHHWLTEDPPVKLHNEYGECG